MKPHISLITLGVNNVKESTEFYQKIGFPVEPSGDITFIKMSNIWLALFGLEDLAKDAGVANKKGEFSGVTLAHNVISETQVDAVIAEVKALGATVVNQPHKREWGGYSGYFQDIDGYLWEVAFNPFAPEIAVDENIMSSSGLNEEEQLMAALYQKARDLVIRNKKASVIFLQMKLLIDMPRATKLLAELEKNGVVGPDEGIKPRKILVTK